MWAPHSVSFRAVGEAGVLPFRDALLWGWWLCYSLVPPCGWPLVPMSWALSGGSRAKREMRCCWGWIKLCLPYDREAGHRGRDTWRELALKSVLLTEIQLRAGQERDRIEKQGRKERVQGGEQRKDEREEGFWLVLIRLTSPSGRRFKRWDRKGFWHLLSQFLPQKLPRWGSSPFSSAFILFFYKYFFICFSFFLI